MRPGTVRAVGDDGDERGDPGEDASDPSRSDGGGAGPGVVKALVVSVLVTAAVVAFSIWFVLR